MEQLHCYISPFTIEKKENVGNLFFKDKEGGWTWFKYVWLSLDEIYLQI